jgi:hypothetical protein
MNSNPLIFDRATEQSFLVPKLYKVDLQVSKVVANQFSAKIALC